MSWLLRRSGGRDTGWRDLTALVTAPVQSGRLLMRRKADDLTVVLDDLAFVEAPASNNIPLPRMAVRFRPRYRLRGDWYPSVGYAAGGSLGITALGYGNLYSASSGVAMSATLTCDAAGAFPTSFPGVEAA